MKLLTKIKDILGSIGSFINQTPTSEEMKQIKTSPKNKEHIWEKGHSSSLDVDSNVVPSKVTKAKGYQPYLPNKGP